MQPLLQSTTSGVELLCIGTKSAPVVVPLTLSAKFVPATKFQKRKKKKMKEEK
jgi:hypothetical protein